LGYNQSNINTDLLQRVADGDEKAFRVLFDNYKDRFYQVVLKMTRSDVVAQELVQDIFLKIWQNRVSLIEINNPEAYFFTVLYRQVYSYYKKMALERKLLKVIAESPAFQNITDETLLVRESERLINEAVSMLPTQQQQVFRLSKQEGLSRIQVAELLKISPHTVRNHLAKSIQFIRSYLNQAGAMLLLCFNFFYLG